VNNRLQVAGYSTGPDGLSRAFLWRDGRMVDLGTLPADAEGFHPTIWRLGARSR
jgi:probable HAF family extracellular repeat protein